MVTVAHHHDRHFVVLSFSAYREGDEWTETSGFAMELNKTGANSVHTVQTQR